MMEKNRNGEVNDMGNTDKKEEEKCLSPCATRRQFLIGSGVATATVLLGIPGLGNRKVEAVVSKYPRQKIGEVSKLKQDKPIIFQYPNDRVSNMLVKLGTPAGGGVGRDNDIVAFNLACTHMGGPMTGSYKAEYKILGPCPFHLSSYDLTRHGILTSGHATQNLPQIELEVEGNDIYATGVVGLIYGYHSNV